MPNRSQTSEPIDSNPAESNAANFQQYIFVGRSNFAIRGRSTIAAINSRSATLTNRNSWPAYYNTTLPQIKSGEPNLRRCNYSEHPTTRWKVHAQALEHGKLSKKTCATTIHRNRHPRPNHSPITTAPTIVGCATIAKTARAIRRHDRTLPQPQRTEVTHGPKLRRE